MTVRELIPTESRPWPSSPLVAAQNVDLSDWTSIIVATTNTAVPFSVLRLTWHDDQQTIDVRDYISGAIFNAGTGGPIMTRFRTPVLAPLLDLTMLAGTVGGTFTPCTYTLGLMASDHLASGEGPLDWVWTAHDDGPVAASGSEVVANRSLGWGRLLFQSVADAPIYGTYRFVDVFGNALLGTNVTRNLFAETATTGQTVGRGITTELWVPPNALVTVIYNNVATSIENFHADWQQLGLIA